MGPAEGLRKKMSGPRLDLVHRIIARSFTAMRLQIALACGFLVWGTRSSDPKLVVDLPFAHSDNLGPMLDSADLYLGATLFDTWKRGCLDPEMHAMQMVWWSIYYLEYYPHLLGLASAFISSHPAAHTCFFMADRLHIDIRNGYVKFKERSSQHCARSQSQLGHSQFLADGEQVEFQVQSAEFGRQLPVADLSEGAFGRICRAIGAKSNDPLGLQSTFYSTFVAFVVIP